MKNLKGKCKKCLGCALLEDKGFNGRKHCKYYMRAEKNNLSLAIFIFLHILFFLCIIIGLYYKFSILCGG